MTNKLLTKSIYDYAFTVSDFFSLFEEIATSRFIYKNLPKGIDERYIEKTLFYKGSAIFFKNENELLLQDYPYLCLELAGETKLTVYGEPYGRRAVAENNFYYDKELKPNNSVIIWNNRTHLPSSRFCYWYAQRIWECVATENQNITLQSTPLAFMGTRKNMLSISNIASQILQKIPYIQINDKSYNISEDVKTIDMKVPFIAKDVNDYARKLWDECLMRLGIINESTKKERKIVDEIEQENADANIYLNSFLMERKKAVEKINDIFGLSIEVEYYGNVYGDFVPAFKNGVDTSPFQVSDF